MLAALLFLQQPNLNQPLTLLSPAQSATAFARQLGLAAHVDVSLAGTLERNTVLAKFDGIPLRLALDNVAHALSAQWRLQGKGIQFYRSVSFEGKLRDLEVGARKGTIEQALERMRIHPFSKKDAEALATRARAFEPRVRAMGRDMEARTEQEAISADMPAGRGMRKLLMEVPVEKLLRLKIGERIVFSSSPNRMQTALPGGARILAEFNAERKLMFEALAEDLKRVEELVPFSDPRVPAFQLRTNATEVVISIARRPESRGFWVLGSFVDADGWPVSQGRLSLPDTPRVPASTLENVELELDDDQLRLAESARSSSVLSMAERRKFVPVLSDPATHEPHGWYVGALLLEYARQTKKPLVAAFSDRSIRRQMLGQDALPKRISAKSIADRMARDWQIVATEEGGTTIVKPAEPLVAEACFLDRALLATALRKLVQEGRMPIPVAAEYAASAKSDLAGEVVEWQFAGYCSPSGFGPDSELMWAPAFPLAKLVGSTPAAYLETSRGVNVSELPTKAAKALWAWIVEAPFTIALGDKRDADHPLQHITSSEPTEALPNGIPGDARLTFSWVSQPMIFSRFRGGPLATIEPYADVAYRLGWESQANWEYDSASARTLTVKLEVPNGPIIEQTLWESPAVGGDRHWRGLTDLPKDVVDLLRKCFEKEKLLSAEPTRFKPPPPEISRNIRRGR